MGCGCIVPKCRSGTSKAAREKTFLPEPSVLFDLPKKVSIRNQWLRSLKLDPEEHTSKNAKRKKNMSKKICHKHFKFDDFLPASQNIDSRGRPLIRPHLKENAIPVLKLRKHKFQNTPLTFQELCQELVKNASENYVNIPLCKNNKTVEKFSKKPKRFKKAEETDPNFLPTEVVKKPSRFCEPKPR